MRVGAQHTVVSTLTTAKKGRFDRLCEQASLHCLTQDEFAALLSNAVAKTSHQAGIDGQVMTEVLLTTKVLPVRILSPSGRNFFIADVAQALDVAAQPIKPMGWLGRPTPAATHKAPN